MMKIIILIGLCILILISLVGCEKEKEVNVKILFEYDNITGELVPIEVTISEPIKKQEVIDKFDDLLSSIGLEDCLSEEGYLNKECKEKLWNKGKGLEIKCKEEVVEELMIECEINKDYSIFYRLTEEHQVDEVMKNIKQGKKCELKPRIYVWVCIDGQYTQFNNNTINSIALARIP